MKEAAKKTMRRQRRKRRVRKRVSGTLERPRLSVFRSHKHIYAQVIDDTASRTLVDASSAAKVLSEKLAGKGGTKGAAEVVGTALAEKAVAAGIRKIVFDRNGYPYHGRIQALADAARKGGLEF